MPIYEYQCTKCGNVKEILQKFSDEAETTCSKCDGNLQKIISQSTFHLKGSGWYVTDYANQSEKSSSAEEPEKKLKKGDSSKVKTKSDSGDSKKQNDASKKVAS